MPSRKVGATTHSVPEPQDRGVVPSRPRSTVTLVEDLECALAQTISKVLVLGSCKVIGT